MARRSNSQWDFGDLFAQPSSAKPSSPPVPAAPSKEVSTAPSRTVVTVSDLTGRIKKSLEAQFGHIWVSGEISNYRLQSSGHAYFVLKDAGAQISCVLFRGQSGIPRTLLRDGAQVVLAGEVTVYEPRGNYQLRVTAAELQGIGALQAAFERLKQKLQSEGLFDASRKRPLPRFPTRIGLITSPTGAAIRDVLHVLRRRCPSLEIILAPCRVQGDLASNEIATAIGRLNRWSHNTGSPRDSSLDLILIARGGGSLEDLWAFNEEIVARAIVASALPVVSAVGHEIDFTISDFASDLRVATPSAAAEIITQHWVATQTELIDSTDRLCVAAHQSFRRVQEQLGQLRQRLDRLHPRRPLEAHEQYLDDLSDRLRSSVRRSILSTGQKAESWTRRWKSLRPRQTWARHQETVQRLQRMLNQIPRSQLTAANQRLASLNDQLLLLSPESVLNRGYSITQIADSNRVVHDATDVPVGTRLKTRLRNGEIFSTVDKPQK